MVRRERRAEARIARGCDGGAGTVATGRFFGTAHLAGGRAVAGKPSPCRRSASNCGAITNCACKAASGPRTKPRVPLFPYQREGMLHLAFTERALLAGRNGPGQNHPSHCRVCVATSARPGTPRARGHAPVAQDGMGGTNSAVHGIAAATRVWLAARAAQGVRPCGSINSQLSTIKQRLLYHRQLRADAG